MIAHHGKKPATLDANEAVASVAYRLSELVSIYPITPSSPMAEHCDEWSAAQRPNIWGEVPEVVQMQSEGGVAGNLHGALMAGSLTTTFTASQGLLLMIPNMFKLAGELTPTVFHVSARAIATHALSIFGDHSDVMACRGTGFAMLAANSCQEAHDFAAIAHVASLRSRLPFLHFFDGFRTSHEVNKVQMLEDATLEALLDEESLIAFYRRALTPDAPSIRGTAQNPDAYFQAREAVNPFYHDAVKVVESAMDTFKTLTGREYKLFQYSGDPEAEHVLVLMGSGAETAEETAAYLNAHQGKKCGVLKVRLYRPFHTPSFLRALPPTVKRIAVLDRTKEPGSIGEPLYLDIALAVSKAGKCDQAPALLHQPLVIGGRYGLGSKEFTPAMVKGVFDHLEGESPHDHFTVGISDDVTHRSITYDSSLSIEAPETIRAVFFGLGSDGTVGANKNTIKVIGEATDLHTQAYFVYDSKKSGGLTVSHLRFGSTPIKAPYLIESAQFVACHQEQFLGRVKMVELLAVGGVFLLNSSRSADQVWDSIPGDMQELLIKKKIRLFHLNAYALCAEIGLGNRINTLMQTAFFAISELIPVEDAVARLKNAIKKTYSKKGDKIVAMNCDAIDRALASLTQIPVPATATSGSKPVQWVPDDAPDFVKRVTARLLAGEGDLLPVSAFPVDGVWPTGTSKYEKREIAHSIPIWDAELCTQCNNCALICPHAAIRPKLIDTADLEIAPAGFLSADCKLPGGAGKRFTLQVSPQDCTGCQACVEICPARSEATAKRAIEMAPLAPILEREKSFFEFFLTLPNPKPESKPATPRNLPLRQPLFEFSGACSGCTQTPYVRSLTQLFGDRLLIANATGCSSIYGGNLPTTPYCTTNEGRGPAWANSLFEDNAEFGLGLHIASEQKQRTAFSLIDQLTEDLEPKLIIDLKANAQSNDAEIAHQRTLVADLKTMLEKLDTPISRRLLLFADYLVKKSTWIVGGDGWAYDIGFGGLDHILASGRNVNILVLDTEVYSNTGGQSSKATPIGAQAKFAAAGKSLPKKDLAQIAMSYGQVYVAQISMGANYRQAIDALQEAESFEGPSLILAYGPCVAHGIDLKIGPARQKAAVESGYWPLFRHDPRRREQSLPSLMMDSMKPTISVLNFMQAENRFRVLLRSDPAHAALLARSAQEHVDARLSKLESQARFQDDDDDEGWG